MASLTNADSGRITAANIVKHSLLVQNMYAPGATASIRPISGEMMDLTKENQAALTVVDTSKFILIPLYSPEIYTKQGDGNLKVMMKACLKVIADTATSVTIFENGQLERVEGTSKNANSIDMITKYTGMPTKCTLQMGAEYSNFFVTNTIDHWMKQISDPYSNSAPYNGLMEEFTNAAHSAGMAYIMYNPTMTRVEAGALILQMIPLMSPKENYNSDATSPSIPSYSLEFSAKIIDHSNLRVREILTSLLGKYRNFIGMDSGLQGMVNGTQLKMVDRIKPDEVFASYLSRD